MYLAQGHNAVTQVKLEPEAMRAAWSFLERFITSRSPLNMIKGTLLLINVLR